MKILISAESTIDMPQNLLDKYSIKTLPFGIYLGEELTEDRFGISDEIYKYVDETKNLPKTSAIPPEDAILSLKLSSISLASLNSFILAFISLSNFNKVFNLSFISPRSFF